MQQAKSACRFAANCAVLSKKQQAELPWQSSVYGQQHSAQMCTAVDSDTFDDMTMMSGAVTSHATAHWSDHTRCGCLPGPVCLQPPASQSLQVCIVQDKLKIGDVQALPEELQAVIIGLTQRDPRSRFTVQTALHLLTKKPGEGSLPGQVSLTSSLRMDDAHY